MTTDEFEANVEKWLATARHPRYGQALRPTHLSTDAGSSCATCGRTASRPSSFPAAAPISCGSGVSGSMASRLSRSSARRADATLRASRSGPVLVKTLDYLFVDDKDGQARRHPRVHWPPAHRCFGNSDGDKAMLEYTTIDNPRPSLGLIVHHTDAEREYAYDAQPKAAASSSRHSRTRRSAAGWWWT